MSAEAERAELGNKKSVYHGFTRMNTDRREICKYLNPWIRENQWFKLLQF